MGKMDRMDSIQRRKKEISMEKDLERKGEAQGIFITSKISMYKEAPNLSLKGRKK